MKHVKLILVILIALIVVVLAVQNIKPLSNTIEFRMNLVFLDEIRTPEYVAKSDDLEDKQNDAYDKKRLAHDTLLGTDAEIQRMEKEIKAMDAGR